MCQPSKEDLEGYRKRAIESPIFGTDMSKQVSEIINDIRQKLLDARGMINDIDGAYKGHGERLKSVEGLLTCGVSVLYGIIEEVATIEVKNKDREEGQSLPFRSRGIGLDLVKNCFVCGTTKRHSMSNEYMHNISAFVDTKQHGEIITYWFPKGSARLDFRESEPNWIQVKIGSCSEHKENLEKLHDITSKNHGVIRQVDIAKAKK